MCRHIKKNRDSIAKHMKILYNDKKMNCKNSIPDFVRGILYTFSME